MSRACYDGQRFHGVPVSAALRHSYRALRQPNRQKIHNSVMHVFRHFSEDEWPNLLVVVRDTTMSTSRAGGDPARSEFKPTPSCLSDPRPTSLGSPHRCRGAGMLPRCRRSAAAKDRVPQGGPTLRTTGQAFVFIGTQTVALRRPYVIERNGRGEWIRTTGLLVPNQALYQAEPRPEPTSVTGARQLDKWRTRSVPSRLEREPEVARASGRARGGRASERARDSAATRGCRGPADAR